MHEETREFRAMALSAVAGGLPLVAYAPAREDLSGLEEACLRAGREARHLDLTGPSSRRWVRPSPAGDAVIDLARSLDRRDVAAFLTDLASFRFAEGREARRREMAAGVGAYVSARAVLGEPAPSLGELMRLDLDEVRALAGRVAAEGPAGPEAASVEAAVAGLEADWDLRAGSELRRLRMHWGGDALDAFPDDGRPRVSVPGVVSGAQVLLMSGDTMESKRCVHVLLGALAREARRSGLPHPTCLLHRGSVSREGGQFAKAHAEAEGLTRLGTGHTVAMVPPGGIEPLRERPERGFGPGQASAEPAVRRLASGDALASGAGGHAAVLWSGREGLSGIALDIDARGWCVSAHLTARDGVRPGPADRAALARDVRAGRLALHRPDGAAWAAAGLDVMPVGAWVVDAVAGRGEPWAWADPASLAEVAALLDLPLLAACHACPEPERAHLAAVSFPGPGRRDFLAAWGALGPLYREASVDAAIREGRPTLPVVARLLGTDRARTRRLLGRPSLPACWGRAVSRAASGNGPASLPYLAALGPDLLPRRGDGAGWEGLVRCFDALDRLVGSQYLDAVGDALGARLLLGGGGDWASRAARVGQNLNRYEDAGDMVRELQRLVGPFRAEGAGSAFESVIAALGRRGGLAAIAGCSDRWHAHPVLPRANAGGAAALPPDAAWPPLFEGAADLGGGWSALCLSRVAALDAEGAAGADAEGGPGLNHCVATYATAAAEGRCHILSLRHGGARVSTAELVPDAGGDHPVGPARMRLAQHRGRRNAVPPVEAERRLMALLGSLADGSLSHVPDALRSRAAPAPVPGAPPPALADLLELWQPVLPAWLRGLDLPALAARIDGAAR